MKGYTYQQSIFILFLAVMDTQRSINKIIVEATDTTVLIHHISLYARWLTLAFAGPELKRHFSHSLSHIIIIR